MRSRRWRRGRCPSEDIGYHETRPGQMVRRHTRIRNTGRHCGPSRHKLITNKHYRQHERSERHDNQQSSDRAVRTPLPPSAAILIPTLKTQPIITRHKSPLHQPQLLRFNWSQWRNRYPSYFLSHSHISLA